MWRIWFFIALSAEAVAGMRTVQVDAGKGIGAIRSLQGVNCGPAGNRAGESDVSRQYKELRIDMIRAHDYAGPVDIDDTWNNTKAAALTQPVPGTCIFPNWDKDPDKEESYNWGPTDRVLKPMIDAGAEVFYQIGRTWGADPTPPPDFDKYANIVKHVVMHYNGGWSNGFHYNIRYWEVWNEPDLTLPAGGKRLEGAKRGGWYWGGTPLQFYEFYEKVARAIKSYDPALQVGGPAQAAGGMISPYREGFIAYCAASHAPLDFFSWHRYATDTWDPYDLARIGQDVQRLLDAQGLRKTANIVDEWNMDLDLTFGPPVNQISIESAAYTASALAYLEDSPVSLSMYYRGNETWMGLFNRDGSYRKKAYAFRAMGMMLDTPQRLAAAGADTFGFAVLAGRSADRHTVQILISNYEIPERKRKAAGPEYPGLAPRRDIVYRDNGGYKLRVTNLPWGKDEFTVTRYRTTETENWVKTQSAGRGGTLELGSALPPPGMDLIVLQQK